MHSVLRRKISALAICAIVAASTSLATEAWVVRTDSTGPTKVGMTLSELNSAVHEKFSMPADKEDQGCFYVSPSSHPQISFMIEDGRLARVDVDKPGVLTAEGIQVGDSEQRARRIYGSEMRVEPSAYGGPGDHYLTVRSHNGKYGIRFETENGKITMFYAGSFKAIQYIEGCE